MNRLVVGATIAALAVSGLGAVSAVPAAAAPAKSGCTVVTALEDLNIRGGKSTSAPSTGVGMSRGKKACYLTTEHGKKYTVGGRCTQKHSDLYDKVRYNYAKGKWITGWVVGSCTKLY